MAVYFANTEITGIKDLFPLSSKDITGLYFADTELFTVWGEYDGTLPAQYTANGSALADYRVYGASGGVGDRTDNLCYRIIKNTTIDGNGRIVYDTKFDVAVAPVYQDTSYSSLNPSNIYAWFIDEPYLGNQSYNQSRNTEWLINKTSPLNGFVAVRYIKANSPNAMIVEGSTAPAEYAPFGYEVDMSVSDGTASTTTPIYIGSDPLGEDEYVSFKEQKVYRRTTNDWNLTAKDFEDSDIVTTVAKGYVITGLKASTNYTMSTNFPKMEGGAVSIWFGGTNSISNGVAEGQNKTKVSTANGEIIVYYRMTELPNFDTYWYMINEGTEAETYTPYYQPHDPPVPLPALPTVDGVNIVDYAGQSAAVPRRFVAKYRKEGFK